MKKFLVVLLSLGLIAAFGMTASAADMKVGGSYYVVGFYEDNPGLSPTSNSHALFYQRVRLQPVFQIAEGLTFTARMDAMEKVWGDSRWRRGGAIGGDDTTSSRRNGTGNQKIQESIEFERGYVTFMTGIGQFQVGYQAVDEWGTTFGNNGTTRNRIMYRTKLGDLALGFNYEKVFEADQSAAAGFADADANTYALYAVFQQKAIEAGLLLKYYDYNHQRLAGGAQTFTLISPYAKATLGPVFVEAEVDYFTGKAFKSELAGVPDVDLKAWAAYIHAKMNLGPAYLGAQFAFASGDDGGDPTEVKTAPCGAGTDWNPALILDNDDFATWTAGVAATPDSQKKNRYIYNLYAGFKPMPKLAVEASLTYAKVHKIPVGVARDKKLGTEFDITATYKIYDNLSYMVGAGYLWTGDYFKGVGGATLIDDDYLLMNKLSLSF